MQKLYLLFISLLIFYISKSQVTIKMKREGGVSIVPCKVNGLNLKFIFDTGASDVSISLTEASFMLKNDYLTADDFLGKSNYMDANGNLTEGININLREVEIGGLKLFNVKASVVSNLKAPLLLGQSAISKLGIVQLDLVSNTLTILTKNDSLNINSRITNSQDTDTILSEFELLKSKQDSLFEEADDYYTNQNYEECISVCTSIIKEDPKNENAYLLRAVSYDMLENYSSAIKDYSKAIELNPKNHISFSYRGKSKHDINDYVGALADLNKALNLNPKYVIALVWRAQTKSMQKNYDGAIQDFDKAVILNPTDSSLYVGRAKIRRLKKDYKGAIADCNKAIENSSGYAEAYYFRGSSKRNLRDYKGAINDLNIAIELDPELSMAYEERGSIKEHQHEDFDGALEDYNKALEVFPGNIFAEVAKKLLEDKIKNNVWIKVGTANDGSTWLIYNEVASKEYSQIKIWVKHEFKTLTTKKNGKSATYTNGYTLMLCIFNCSEKEFKMPEINNYDSKGNLINSTDYEDYESWKSIPPQSVIEAVLKEVCQRYL